jgi:hypothetical protein
MGYVNLKQSLQGPEADICTELYAPQLEKRDIGSRELKEGMNGGDRHRAQS